MGSDSRGPPPSGAGPDPDGGDGVLLAVIEASPAPMVLSDPNRRDEPIVYANTAFLRLTGYGRPEVIGRNCRFLQGPGTDQAAVEEIRRAVRGRVEVSTEILNYRKDGAPFWNALSISPVFDRSGALAYLFASQLDVTRRRAAEDALDGRPPPGPPPGSAEHDLNNLLQVVIGHANGLDRHAARSGDERLIRQVRALSEAVGRAVASARGLSAPRAGPSGEGGGRPRRPSIVRAEEGGTALRAVQGGGERVLVVDDRAEVAELARTMLESAGYEVEVAHGGREALARLDRGFDLLFSDLVMPGGFDGESLAREARRRRPGLRVLLTTGQGAAADGAEFDTIIKPYRRADLAKAVRAALDRAPDPP